MRLIRVIASLRSAKSAPIGMPCDFRRLHAVCLLALVLFSANQVLAIPLLVEGCTARDGGGNAIDHLFDNNIDTFADIRGDVALPESVSSDLDTGSPEGTAPSLLIDLGAPRVVNRICLTDGDDALLRRIKARYRWHRHRRRTPDATDAPAPAHLVVEVGPTPDELGGVARHELGGPATSFAEGCLRSIAPGEPFRAEVDCRFADTVGRYVRLRLASTGRPFTWRVAELEVNGYAHVPDDKRDAVVLPIENGGAALDAKDPRIQLVIAARELSYYIGALTGRPVPVVMPDQAGDYPGSLYVIEDLAPLAKAGHEDLPTDVNVERDGRRITFRAWPYLNVLNSVWEFLRRQGVSWVYPGAHGEVLPAGSGVNNRVAPFHYTPSASHWRYANFATQNFAPRAPLDLQDGWLFWWRNGYDSTWGKGNGPYGAEEVPPRHPRPANFKCPDEFKGGFSGYPHNFARVVPWHIVKEHPDWIGRHADGTPVKGASFCPTSPSLIDWVVKKAEVLYPPPDSDQQISLLPMDACSWCLCERCQALDGPAEGPGEATNDGQGNVKRSVSESYYFFINEVAKKLKVSRPHMRIRALAYGSCWTPPTRIERFPDNVIIEVCTHEHANNLPLSAERNLHLRETLAAWRRKCTHMQHYSYALLTAPHREWQYKLKSDPFIPYPLITGTVSLLKHLAQLDALNGGTQGDFPSLLYAPWGHYVYPRLMWDVELSADTVLDEFFAGYFREASQPMRAYYKTLEDHLVKHNIGLTRFCHGGGAPALIIPGAFTPEILAAMRPHLEQAETLAAHWIVKRRVGYMRAGFDWMLENLGLEGQPWDDLNSYPTIGPEPRILISDAPEQPYLFRQGFVSHAQARSLHVDKNGTQVKKYIKTWRFGAQGDLGRHVRVPRRTRARVTAEVWGRPYDNEWPVMTLRCGDTTIASIPVETQTPRTYTFEVELSAGTQQFIIEYRNAADKGRRNLMIRSVAWEGLERDE